MKKISSVLLTIAILWQTIITCGIAISAATSKFAITSPPVIKPMESAVVSYLDAPNLEWTEEADAAGYRISIRNLRTNELLVENEWTAKTWYSLDGVLDEANCSYKVWVGAMSSKSAAGVDAFTWDYLQIDTQSEVPCIEDEDWIDRTYNSVVLCMNITKDNGSAITDSGFYFEDTNTGEETTYSFKQYGSYSATTKGYKEMTITGLKPDTLYYFYAYAINGVGETVTSRGCVTTEEYDCPHTYGVYTNKDPDSIKYVDIDDETQHKEIWYYDEYCYYCDKVVTTKAVKETYYRDHTWRNDVCQNCKYAKVCQHNNTYADYYETTYGDITETTHTRYELYHNICEDCGEQLDSYDWDTYKNEKHTFKKDVCTECGYTRAEELTLTVSVTKTEIVVGEYVSVNAKAAGGSGGYQYTYYVYANGEEVDAYVSDEAYGHTAKSVGEFYFKVTVTDSDRNSVTVNSPVITVTEDESVVPEIQDIQIYTPTEGEEIDRLDPTDLTWAAVETADAYWVSIYNATGTCLSTTKCTDNIMPLVDMLPTAASYYTVEIHAYNTDATKVGYGSSYFYTCAETPIVATGSSTNITDHSTELLLTIIRDGGSTITESGFYVGTNANALTTRYPINGTCEKGEHSLVIEGLTANETYYYQAYAINEMGEGVGAVYAFTTSSSMPLLVSPTTLTFPGNAGDDTISVNADGDWEVTVTKGADWITVNRQYGFGSRNVKVSVDANDTSMDRTGTIQITDDTGSVYITIQQDCDVIPTLQVNTENLSVGADKVVVDTIRITSNAEWSVTSTASWIVPSVSSGKYDDTISLAIQANTSSTQRTGEIKIRSGEHLHTITVTQKAPSRPWIQDFVSTYTVFANEKFNLHGIVSAADGGTLKKITVKSVDNRDFSVTVYTNDVETYDLGNLAAFDTAALPIYNVAGTYTYAIYATADNFTIADNEIGRFTVTVKEIPLEDAQVSLFSTATTATSVTVKGKIVTLGSYSFEECGVILYDATKTQIDKVTFNNYPKTNTGVFTATFDDLSAGTTYYYKCYLKAGGITYYAFSGYDSVITNNAIIQDILLDVANGYYDMDSNIYVNTGEQFSILIYQQPSNSIVDDYSIQLNPSAGAELIPGQSAQVIINQAGNYTLTITLTGEDGLSCIKEVTIHAESESLKVTCCCQQNYAEPAKNKTEPFQDSFTLFPVYRSSYFAQSSYSGYNHELAKLALGLCVAGFTTNEHDPNLNYKDLEITGNYTEDKNNQDYYDRVKNIANAYTSLGIAQEDMHFYGYEESLNSNANNVAFSIAKKYANVDGEDQVILFIVLRGGGYVCEWASNFEIGDETVFAKGFHEASQYVYTEVLDFINNLSASEQQNLKILITGYSRAAATANLTTFSLNQMATASGGVDMDDIFCYCFATPRTLTEYYLDYFKEYYTDTFYDNIHNIINPGDVVPQVPMYHDAASQNGWSFVRFGVDHYFPSGNFSVKVNTSNEKGQKLKSRDVYNRVNDAFYSLQKYEIDSKVNVALEDEIQHVIDLLVELVGDREQYANSYSKLINAALHQSMSEYGVACRQYAHEVLNKDDNQIDVALAVGEAYANAIHNNIVKISWIADYKIGELLYTLHDDLKWICALTYLEYGENVLRTVNQSIIDFVNDASNRAKILFESSPQLSLSLKDTALNVIEGAASTIAGYLQLFSKDSGLYVSHQPALYASWLYSFTPAEMCALFHEIYNPLLTVACPVDVYFYDDTGVLVASVVGDTITNNTEDIQITLIDDVKTIAFPDATYRIEIVPVAEGNMDVSVTNIDNTGSEVQKQYFNDVTLDTSLEYELIRTVDENGTVIYQLLDSYNNAVATESTITGEIQTIHTQVEVMGHGTVVYQEYVSPGTYVTITAIPNEGEAFIGWYIDSQLISTTAAYSFFAEESQVFTAKFTTGAAVQEPLLGDVNADGMVDKNDSILLQQYFAGWPKSIDPSTADVNQDGVLTRADAMILARYLAKWAGYDLPYSGTDGN